MDIVIISEFCDDFSATDNDRFLYLAKLLCAEHDVEIVTSTFRHITKSRRTAPAAEWPFKITFIEEPGYPRNICLKRFASHNKWGRNVYKYLKERKKPDVVYCAIPSLTGPACAARFCQKQGSRYVIDVQDLWPEAFKMILNIPLLSDVIFAPFTILANAAYRGADAICAVSDTYVNRALRVNKRCKEGNAVFLGTNLETFDEYAAQTPIMSKPEGEIWLAYCGTLGASYDITCVIDALSILNDPSLKFIVMGDGPRKEEFEIYARDKEINAAFTGRLKYSEMCSLLSECDITINPIVKGAAASIINKHADYAASGIPVLNTQESKEYRDIVRQYDMGFNCRNNDAEDLADKIRILIRDPERSASMGRNARKCAEERFDRKRSYQKLINACTGN